MRLESTIKLSKGVATIKEITPADFVLALYLAIEKYGDVRINDIEQTFWNTVWLDHELIELDGEFTEQEFMAVMERFSALNNSLFKQPDGGHVATQQPVSNANKRLSRIAQEVQTECAMFISLHNYQAVFCYGFSFIQQLQKLHKK